MNRPRVVITGLSAITPLGNDLETTWKRLLAGESGIAPITLFDATDYDSRVAGEVKDFVAEDFIPAKQGPLHPVRRGGRPAAAERLRPGHQ